MHAQTQPCLGPGVGPGPGQVKVTLDSSPAGRPGGPYELAGGSCEGRPSRLTAGRPLVWDTEMPLQGQGAPVALEQ